MKNFAIITLIILFSTSCFSQKEFKIINQTENSIKIQVTLPERQLLKTEVNGIDYVDFSKMFKTLNLEQGSPSIPVFGETFMIPNSGATFLEISDESVFEEYANIEVLPSKGNLKRNVNPSEIPFVFGEKYQINEFFPNSPVSLVNPFILRTIRGQVARVYPYQYNPVTKTLKVYSKLVFEINRNPSIEGINEITKNTNPSDIKFFENLFANSISDKYSAVDESGEMLIISADDYASTVKPLADWKNKKGIKTKIVKLSEIGTSTTDIKNYVSNFYDENSNLKYLLLVGDSDKMPVYSYGSTWSEELYSDSYFGQLAGDDYYPEVFVGRFSGNNTDVDIMVRRILEYEQNPKEGDWMTKAIGIASAEGAGYGDEGQADWQHMRELRSLMLDFGYTKVYEFYEGSRGQEDEAGNPTPEPILAAVNEGVGLFNYCGHGDISSCVTGNYSSSHVNQANNFGTYPFVVSVACNNGTFVGATCFAETWLKAKKDNQPTGAIAMCASSILMAWAPPMETQDEMTLINTHAYENNRKTTVGGLFYNGQMSMLEEYGSEGDEVMQTWIFFGDPSVDFRNKITQNLTVNHVNEILPNLEITSLFESITEDATISLSVNNTFLTKGSITNGVSSIIVPALESNTLIDVVATKQNYKPYFGQITVGSLANLNENNSESISIYPNPAKDILIIKFSENNQFASFKVVDILGKNINVNILESDNFQSTISLSNLTSGVYTIQIETNNGIVSKRIIKN
jgi:gingipain R